MSQSHESLIDLTQTAAQRPAKSESELAAGLISRFTMKDGTDVSLWPIRPDDEPLMAQFHQNAFWPQCLHAVLLLPQLGVAHGARAPGSHLSR
jgi:hypothetical protein